MADILEKHQVACEQSLDLSDRKTMLLALFPVTVIPIDGKAGEVHFYTFVYTKSSGKSPLLPVVRGFAGDGDVVDVAFAQASAGDAAEFGVGLQGGDVGTAGIAHAGA